MKNINELKKELISLSLKIGDYYGINLDFSIESINNVEAILSKVANKYENDKNNEGIQGIALELAAYIISVIEKNIIIGEWERDSKEFGEDTFPYNLGSGNIIFPYIWCQKRIYDGSGEDIWSKFKALVLDKNIKT
jgi:hypothetical protein